MSLDAGEPRHPGHQFHFTIPAANGEARCRFYLVGTRLYQVIAMGMPDFVQSGQATEVLDSFKLLKSKRGREDVPLFMSHQGWNRLAAEFEESVCDITASSSEQLVDLVNTVCPTRRQTLIDAGCGIGSFAKQFGPRFGKVIAFDFASAMVRRARGRCRELTHATWQTLPLEDAGTKLGAVGHLVACLNVITSPRAELRMRQWESVVQLVRPGRHLLVVVPSLESARYVAKQDAEAFGGTLAAEADLVRRRDTEQKHYTRQELRRALVARGMKVVSLRRIHYPWDDDGLEENDTKPPWDWVSLAQKPLAG